VLSSAPPAGEAALPSPTFNLMAGEFDSIVVRRAGNDALSAGHLTKPKNNLNTVTLVNRNSEVPPDFEQVRLVGKEEERARIAAIFHNEVTPGLMAVIFKLEVLELKLEAARSPYMQQAAEAARMLSETVDKITETLIN
jgi:signal transduction histidine kinase